MEAVIAVVDTAPFVVSALPVKIDPVSMSIAPVLTIMFPLKIVLGVTLTAPLTNQYTFFASVPLIKTIFAPETVLKAPYILIINTALATPCASR